MSDETKIPMPPVVIVPPKPKILLHEPDEEFTVKTCCNQTSSCDKSLIQCLVRFLISTNVLAFCFVQLGADRGDSSYFSATISLILGTYLSSGNPSPPPSRKGAK